MRLTIKTITWEISYLAVICIQILIQNRIGSFNKMFLESYRLGSQQLYFQLYIGQICMEKAVIKFTILMTNTFLNLFADMYWWNLFDINLNKKNHIRIEYVISGFIIHLDFTHKSIFGHIFLLTSIIMQENRISLFIVLCSVITQTRIKMNSFLY